MEDNLNYFLLEDRPGPFSAPVLQTWQQRLVGTYQTYVLVFIRAILGCVLAGSGTFAQILTSLRAFAEQ